jgi:hypothetical protein
LSGRVVLRRSVSTTVGSRNGSLRATAGDLSRQPPIRPLLRGPGGS